MTRRCKACGVKADFRRDTLHPTYECPNGCKAGTLEVSRDD